MSHETMVYMRATKPSIVIVTLALCGFSACDDGDGSNQNPPFDFADFTVPDLFDPGDGGVGDGYGYQTGDAVSDSGADVFVPPCNEITFSYASPATSVWVSGTFNGWAETPATGALELAPSAGGGFELTTLIEPPGRHQYKFIIDGTTWVQDPNEPRLRYDGVGDYNSELVLCDDTGPACTSVTFHYEDATAGSVLFSGSALGWPTTAGEGALPFVNDGAGGWTATVEMPPGEHTYKLIVDGNWIDQPTNPDRIDDGFGGFNSLVRVCDGEVSACGEPSAFDWRDVVMYFAMIDRFEDSDGAADPVAGATGGDAFNGPSGQYEGGDLVGATNRVPYLTDLGITALWLSAPYENRDSAGAAIDPGVDPNNYSGYHGYWPSPADIDFSDPANPSPRPAVESKIGTEADLRALIDTAHAAPTVDGHGMKVLFDYVMNHVDNQSPLYQAHPDWFATKADGSTALCGPENLWDDPFWGTRCAFTDYLPPLDFDNPDALRWSVDDALWWATEFGIDGYRLDAIKHVSQAWLLELRAQLNARIPDPAGDRFYLVGETFAYDDPALLASFIDPETKLDGQFDFPFKARLCEAAFGAGGAGFGEFERWLREENDRAYPNGTIMTTWIGNHDIPRAIHFASREIGNCREGSNYNNGWQVSWGQPGGPEAYERLAVAFAVMFTNPGIPLIYYGDEVGLAGGGDPDNRRMLPPDSSLNAHQLVLRDRVAELGRIRAEHKALSRGRRVTESVNADVWVFRMTGCGGSDVLVAINRADNAQPATLPSGSWTDLRSGASSTGGSVSIPARDYLIFSD